MAHRYAELRPNDLARLWQANPLAIVPFGALEWHGDHLPLGLDLFVAEHFGALLSEATGGVLLPAINTPITTLPHPMSLQISTEAFRVIVDDLLEGLYKAGARQVILLTGHYAHAHEIELYEAALRAMDDHPGLLVFAASPLEPLGDDALLDHAARYEASQLLAVRPDLVALDRATDGPPRETAILGEHPRVSTANEGNALFSMAIEAWQNWLKIGGLGQLEDHYRARFDAYQPFVSEHYTNSWEEAIIHWWESK